MYVYIYIYIHTELLFYNDISIVEYVSNSLKWVPVGGRQDPESRAGDEREI